MKMTREMTREMERLATRSVAGIQRRMSPFDLRIDKAYGRRMSEAIATEVGLSPDEVLTEMRRETKRFAKVIARIIRRVRVKTAMEMAMSEAETEMSEPFS